MKVRNKNILDAIQLNHDNYEEFKKYLVEEKYWNVSPLHGRMTKVWCYITNILEPTQVYEGDYVIFKDGELVEIIDEKNFNKKYETTESAYL